MNNSRVPILAVVALCGLGVGYFAGREHLKYEIRQSIGGIAGKVSEAFSPKPAKAPTPKPGDPFKVTLISKTVLPKDVDAIKGERARFEIDFANLTAKHIRAFDGTLIFTDLLGNAVYGGKIEINTLIPSFGTQHWTGERELNPYIADQQAFKRLEFKNAKIIFQTRKVLFIDGTTKEY